MLTLNADVHPLISRMHKPDRIWAPSRKSARSLLLEPVSFDQWLAGTVQEARLLMQLTPVETFQAGPFEA